MAEKIIRSADQWDRFWGDLYNEAVLTDASMERLMEIIKEEFNVEVEPPPILPNRTPGRYTPEDAGVKKGWMVVSDSAPGALASFMTEGDARVYAAAPEVIEAAVRFLRECFPTGMDEVVCHSANGLLRRLCDTFHAAGVEKIWED